MAKNRIVKFRHKVYFCLARPIGFVLGLKYHFHYKMAKLDKKQAYFVMANHQALLDPALLCMSFRRPLYIVANDSLFNDSLGSRALQHCFSPIEKRKAVADVGCIRNCARVAREGGSVAIFPEGNRAWADFQFYIDPAICKMVRLLKLPVVLYNFSGGYGVDPRWGRKSRRGKFVGQVSQVIPFEELAALSDEDMHKRICDGLRVIDSESGEKFTSPTRAEYLERELFICPKCGSVHTIRSEGAEIICDSCGLHVEYGEDLALHCSDPDFRFTRLVEWYNFQLETIKNRSYEPDEVIFADEDVEVRNNDTTAQELLAQGKLLLTGKSLTIGDIAIAMDEVTAATVVSGTKLIVNTPNGSYIFHGKERFNALKYVLMFNVLSERIEDKYYGF